MRGALLHPNETVCLSRLKDYLFSWSFVKRLLTFVPLMTSIRNRPLPRYVMIDGPWTSACSRRLSRDVHLLICLVTCVPFIRILSLVYPVKSNTPCLSRFVASSMYFSFNSIPTHLQPRR